MLAKVLRIKLVIVELVLSMVVGVSGRATAPVTRGSVDFNVDIITGVPAIVELTAMTPLEVFVPVLYTIDLVSGVTIDVKAGIIIGITL